MDLRETRLVCSIDPPGCTDIDDALSVHKLPNGNYEFGVHIADVTYFVPAQSPIDIEVCLLCFFASFVLIDGGTVLARVV